MFDMTCVRMCVLAWIRVIKTFSDGANGRVLTQVEQEFTEAVRNATRHKETLI